MTVYLDWRDAEIDTTEWRDIEAVLRLAEVVPPEVVVELCAGKGHLIRFLWRRMGLLVEGVDLEGCRYHHRIKCLDLEEEDPPPARVYIFQHCLEHISQPRALELMRYMGRRARLIVGILPGHPTRDPTHKKDFYTREEALALARASGLPHAYAVPDTNSYLDPASLDWLVVASKEPVRVRYVYPFLLRVTWLLVRWAVEGRRVRLDGV